MQRCRARSPPLRRVAQERTAGPVPMSPPRSLAGTHERVLVTPLLLGRDENLLNAARSVRAGGAAALPQVRRVREAGEAAFATRRQHVARTVERLGRPLH